ENALKQGLVEGDLRFDGTTVIPVEPHRGRGLLRTQAEQLLASALASTKRFDISLPVGEVTPHVDQTAVDAAPAQARSLLATNHVAVAGLVASTLTPKQLAGTLGTRTAGNTLELTIDARKLQAALGPAFTAAAQPAVDASFAISATNTVS